MLRRVHAELEGPRCCKHAQALGRCNLKRGGERDGGTDRRASTNAGGGGGPSEASEL